MNKLLIDFILASILSVSEHREIVLPGKQAGSKQKSGEALQL
jgi:hypothetical protein